MMSDPVSNAEIEDVLSSIRRLVSSGDREKSHVQLESSNDVAEKLVLTPALRVDASDEAQHGDFAPVSGNAGVAALGDKFEFRQSQHDDVDETSGDSEHSTSNEHDSAGEASSEPESHDDDLKSDPASHDVGSAESEDQDTDDQGADASDMSEGGPEPSEQDQSEELEARIEEAKHEGAALGERIAEVEDAVAARDDEWEPDGESNDLYAGSDVSSMAWEDYGSDPADDDAERGATGPEVIFARTGYDQHLSGTQHVAANGRADYWPATSSDAKTADDDAIDPDIWSDDGAAIIDEDTLRDMVSEIVRQELQGALGERITRNVRKLVRREIQRALTSQEFD